MHIRAPTKPLHFSTSITFLLFRFLSSLISNYSDRAATHNFLLIFQGYDKIVENIPQAEGKDIHNSQFYTSSLADQIEKPLRLGLCVKLAPLREIETKTTPCAFWLEQHELGATSWEAEKVLGVLVIGS